MWWRNPDKENEVEQEEAEKAEAQKNYALKRGALVLTLRVKACHLIHRFVCFLR